MISILYGMIILLAIAVFSDLLTNYLNKDIRSLEIAAKKQVRNKLLKREQNELFFKKIHIDEQNKYNAIRILSGIAKIIGIQDINFFYVDDRLKDILRIELNELDNISLYAWKKAGLENYIEVYSYEIMEFFNKIIKQDVSEKILREISCNGDSTDDEIIDALFSLKLKELLKVISLIK